MNQPNNKKFHYTPNFWRYLIVAVFLVLLWNWGENMIRKLIYFPETDVSAHELGALVDAGFASLDDTGGFLRTHPDPEKIIITFHGNAGHTGHRIYMAHPFLNEPYTIFLAEYPGYGDRKGTPKETAIYRAALEDIQKLKKKHPETPLVLIGESLGTGVASWLAPQINPQGLVLISPYTSLVEVGKTHYPFLPVSTLLKDRYESIEHLKNQKIPILFVHGKNDEIVPFELGKELHESYSGPKEMIVLEGHHHNDLPWLNDKARMVTGIKDWVKRLGDN